MNTRSRLFGLLLLVTLVISACGGVASTPEAMMEAEGDIQVAMDKDDSEDMMEAAPDPAATEEGDSGGMMEEEIDLAAREEDDAGSKKMDDVPAWFSAELIDVSTGETVVLTDLKGKVVLVETMAIWCSNCLRQQNEVKALHEDLGAREDLVTLVLDVDPNENTADLREYAARHGFTWTYVVAPREVAREIGQLYGDQFLNPPSTPMLIVDQQGAVHLLPFGRKSAADLKEALAPFLSSGLSSGL